LADARWSSGASRAAPTAVSISSATSTRRWATAKGVKAGYVFVNERGAPFGRMGIGRMIERAGEAAGLPFPVHVHMLRHSTGYALAARGMDTRRLQHFLCHASITNTVRYTAMSPEPFKDIWRS
jgi:site-specific recombinase XerD